MVLPFLPQEGREEAPLSLRLSNRPRAFTKSLPSFSLSQYLTINTNLDLKLLNLQKITLYVYIYDRFMIVILYDTKPKIKKKPEKPSTSPRAAERAV